jgi:hypothetical protein
VWASLRIPFNRLHSSEPLSIFIVSTDQTTLLLPY